jgi:hypothetical protein
MALTVINAAQKIRQFLVYDLEWVPGSMRLRICGVYDKGRGYRAYSSIEQFLREEVTDKNRGKWFYAHAGGMADLTFIVEKILEFANRAGFNYSMEASFSGSSAIIVKLCKGKNVWHFVDSYWLLRDKLENIGKWIGYSKGHNVAGWEDMTREERKRWYAEADTSDLLVYNHQDCYILWHAIDQFQKTILEMGGQLQMTLASTAMFLFRRRFLTHDIEIPPHVNEAARQAYYSSRVEVFQSHCEEGYYYDINSSFPYAMTFPCPGQYLGSQRTLPRRPDVIYIADVEVKVPDSYLPPLPYRVNGRVFFPVGSWRTWMTQIDLELLLENGGELLKVHEAMGFEPFHDLKAYAEKFYELRKKSTNDFEKITGKLLMNSLYGKFGESAEKQQMHLNPTATKEWELREKEASGQAEMIFPGAWLEDNIVEVPHMHVPIGAHITSLARRTLFNFLKGCEEVYYSDTDSVVTTTKLPTSKDLGGLKLEYIIVPPDEEELRMEQAIYEDTLEHGAEFYSPKLYRMHALDPETGKRKLVYRAKGFSLDNVDNNNPRAIAVDRWFKGDERERALRAVNFAKIIRHEPVHFERMMRIKEMIRTDNVKPQEAMITKSIRHKVVPWDPLPKKSDISITKRFMYPDGNSRPWFTDELHDILG